MTFIAAFSDTGFTGLTDVVLSVEAGGSAIGASRFPMHDIPPQGGERVTVDFGIKSIIINPQTVFMYSGRMVVSLKFLHFVADTIRLGGGCNFTELCREFDAHIQRINEEHFVINQIKVRNDTFGATVSMTSTWQMNRVNLNGTDTFTAGSGLGDLIKRLKVYKPDESALPQLSPWHLRLVAGICDEMTSDSPLNQGYGGWYEVTVHKDGRFEKFPYSIIWWKLYDGELNLVGPVIGSRYFGNSLLIHRINVEDGGAFREHVTRLDDPLGRDKAPLETFPIEDILDTEMHLHVVVDGSNLLSTYSVIRTPRINMLTISTVDGALRYNLKEELMANIIENHGNDQIGRMKIE